MSEKRKEPGTSKDSKVGVERFAKGLRPIAAERGLKLPING